MKGIIGRFLNAGLKVSPEAKEVVDTADIWGRSIHVAHLRSCCKDDQSLAIALQYADTKGVQVRGLDQVAFDWQNY